MVVERKKGILEFSLVPIVERNGKKQFLVSFMIALTSKPRNARQVRANRIQQQEIHNFMQIIPYYRRVNGLKFVYLLMVFIILLPM